MNQELLNMPKSQILIVEDDSDLAEWMSDYLTSKDYQVSVTGRGDEAVDMIREINPDIVVLDGMLPGLDGIDVCKAVRPEFSNAIIMVTARDEEIDEVLGLEMGADDYLTKPIRARALLARIRKYLERQSLLKSAITTLHEDAITSADLVDGLLEFNQLIIDKQARMVLLAGEKIDISSNEFDVLWFLATNAGQVVTREQLVKELRGFEYDGFDRSIDLRISRLRKKLVNESTSSIEIKTIWGKGYLLAKEAR